ncbi:hypothetical protein F4677DRAFT_338957 [Hypoxylon crocopeplum]|nr:hypothetical protein F4677DRAFT_338957 [Hypoxylon crocopeplum]
MGGIRMSAAVVEEQVSRLRSLLTRWRSKLPDTVILAYAFEPPYTESNLLSSNLNGRESAMCRVLPDVGSECGFTIFARLIAYPYFNHSTGGRLST